MEKKKPNLKRELTSEQKIIRGRRMIAKLLMERAEKRGDPNPFQTLLDKQGTDSIKAKKKEAAERKKNEQ